MTTLSVPLRDRAVLNPLLEACGYEPLPAGTTEGETESALTGEETLEELLAWLRIPLEHQPTYFREEIAYAQTRQALGRELRAPVPARESVQDIVVPGDDLGHVVGTVLSVRAQELGEAPVTVPLVLQLGTLWGLQELARARAILTLVRELVGPGAALTLQPYEAGGGAVRFGDRLSLLIALMEDLEPTDPRGLPQEGVAWDLGRISAPVALGGLVETGRVRYRALRHQASGVDFSQSAEVAHRTCALVRDARVLLAAMRATIPELYSAQGLRDAMRFGFLGAWPWQPKRVLGCVCLVDREGRVVPTVERARAAAQRACTRTPLGILEPSEVGDDGTKKSDGFPPGATQSL